MAAVNSSCEDHEQIAQILVVAEEWTIENGFMTPTMKVKRDVIERHYGPAITREAGKRKQSLAWLDPMPAAAAPADLESEHALQN